MQWAVLQPCHEKVKQPRDVFEMAQYRREICGHTQNQITDAELDTERRTAS